MYVISLIHFTTFLADIGLIILLLYKNPKALLNRSCSLFIVTFAIWSLGYCFFNIASSSQAAWLWMKISVIGWCAFPAGAFYFYLTLTNKNKLLNNKLLLVVMLAASAYFIYLGWSGKLIQEVNRNTYWWYGSWANTGYSYAFFIYYLILSIICIYLSYDFGRKARSSREKKQSNLLLITGAISFAFGSMVNVILPLLGNNNIPQLADIIVGIWEVGIALAVIKYGLMTLTPEIASDQILSIMKDSLMLVDTSGTIKLANNATKELFGVRDNEINESSFFALVVEKEAARSFLEDTLKNGSSLNHELTYISQSGDTFRVEASASSVLDRSKTPFGFVIVARDISERKRMENIARDFYEKEKSQRQQLEEEAKIRVRFIDVLAHELRGPLTPIMASADMLNRINVKNGDELQKKLSGNILSCTEVMAKRLEELLDLARNARGTFTLDLKLTDLSSFIKEVVSRFRPSIDLQNQQLVLELKDDLPLVKIDPSRMEQVLVNLLSNASKYSPKNSRILLAVTKQSGGVRIEVRDEGIGISPEDQEKLFHPYQRVGSNINKSKGLGLGLIVVKQIIEAHGGKIWITSQPGQGSSFFFMIPFADIGACTLETDLQGQ